MDMTPRPYEFIVVTDDDPDHLPPKVFAEALREFVEITKGATLADDDGTPVTTMDVSFLPLLTDKLGPRIVKAISDVVTNNDHVRAYSYSFGGEEPSKTIRAVLPHEFEWPDEYGDDIEVDGREQVILLAVGHVLGDTVRDFIDAALERGHQILVIDEGLWQLDAITELEQPMSEIDTMDDELAALKAAEVQSDIGASNASDLTEPTPKPKPKMRVKAKPEEEVTTVDIGVPDFVGEPIDPNFGVTDEDNAPMTPEQRQIAAGITSEPGHDLTDEEAEFVNTGTLVSDPVPVTPAGEHDGQQGEHTSPPLNPEWEAMGRNELRDLVKDKGLQPTDFRSKESLLDALYGREPSVKPQRRSPLKKKQDEVEAMVAMDAEIPAIIKALKGVLEEQQGTLDNQQVVLAKLEAILQIGERVGDS